ncbi:hypothetical protein BSKO_11565 [Bryopsis sp. KO-2023]|nr:hypothetical protein BSKO_11565 [Bryopsis sp. KO-2023]
MGGCSSKEVEVAQGEDAVATASNTAAGRSDEKSRGVYDALLAELQASGEVFCDPDFKAEFSSLCDLPSHEKFDKLKTYSWLRPAEIFGETFDVFEDKIEPNDIQQGELATCYMLTALSAMAEWPERVLRILLSQTVNQAGCYGVQFCVRGQWREIIVDDRFPCHNGSLAFSKGSGHQLWVCIIEKAWAKLYGSFMRVEGGFTGHCLATFTGAPVHELRIDEQNLWDRILFGEKQDWIMSTGGIKNKANVEAVGLVESHAYALLAAYKVQTTRGTVRLVKLRNPWGSGEWNGAWSDHSPLWTNDLKNQVGMEDEDDGIFFMSFDDFRSYFGTLSICMYYEGFFHRSLQSEIESGDVCMFTAELHKPSKCFFSVHQDCEQFNKDGQTRKSATISIVVGRGHDSEPSSFEYCVAKTTAAREVWVELPDAKPGKYYIWVRVFWDRKNSGEIGFTSYSGEEVELSQKDDMNVQQHLKQLYLGHARTNCELSDYGESGQPECQRGVDTLQEMTYIYYKNDSESQLIEELEFELDGFELAAPHKGNTVKITIPPKSEELVMLLPTTPSHSSWEMRTTAIFKLPPAQLIKAAKESENVTKRQFKGEHVEVTVHVYMHPGGACYYYQNSTVDLDWAETWNFNAQNVAIVDHEGPIVDISLGPGEAKAVIFERASSDPWKLEASISNFRLSQK